MNLTIYKHFPKTQKSNPSRNSKKYCIHSNNHPGLLKSSFWVGAYLFQNLQGLTPKWMTLAMFRLILSYIELSRGDRGKMSHFLYFVSFCRDERLDPWTKLKCWLNVYNIIVGPITMVKSQKNLRKRWKSSSTFPWCRVSWASSAGKLSHQNKQWYFLNMTIHFCQLLCYQFLSKI